MIGLETYKSAHAITPNDSVDLAVVPKAIYVGGAGHLTVHMKGADPSGLAEVSTVDTAGATAAPLNNKYFVLHDADGSVYAWFNYNATGSDPAPGGIDRGIEVPLAIGDDDADIAAAIATALDADDAFAAAAVTTVVTITDAATGDRTDITAGNSGFVVAVTAQGETTVTFKSVPVGTILPIRPDRVYATGTTATLLLALN